MYSTYMAVKQNLEEKKTKYWFKKMQSGGEGG